MFSIKFNLERSTIIEAPVDSVYKIISDFHSWPHWSPWLCQEPDCPVDISGKPAKAGHAQAWDGQRIGAGRMTLAQAAANSRLAYDLFFTKPWKSRSKVDFTFAENDGGTRVTWSMQGTLPFFLFFMKKMMSAWVGCDYERGLSMLKEYIETGTVLSRVSVDGVAEQPGLSFIGHNRECSLDDVGPSMEAAFTNITQAVERGELEKPDFQMSFYHNYDMVKRRCRYTAALGYRQAPSAQLPDGYVQGTIDRHRALQVTHRGPYRHLGNAWSTAMTWQRSDKLKVNKTIPMYETYAAMPGKVSAEKIETRIFLPVK